MLSSLYDASNAHAQQTDAIVSQVDHNIKELVNQHQQIAHQMTQQFSALVSLLNATSIHVTESIQMQLTSAFAKGRTLSPSAVGEGIALTQGLGLSSLPADQQANDEDNPEFEPRASMRIRPRCTCTKTTHCKERSFFGNAMSFYWQQHTYHKAPCPLSKRSQRLDVMGARISYCTFMFTYILESTVSCTRGAGGYSIGQALVLRRIVSERNPAFLLFRPQKIRNYSQEELSNYFRLDEIICKLDQYFRDGTVSPADVARNHGTLLQVGNKTKLTFPTI
jgi:hypothetical protein